MIALKTILVPTEIGPGPFGAKAVGETINAGVHPAIVNAVRVAKEMVEADLVADLRDAVA